VLHLDQRKTFDDHCLSVQQAALHNPACQSFRVLHDRHHSDHIVILTEWENSSRLMPSFAAEVFYGSSGACTLR
jgi:quinol monooxygenase YgiN